MASAYLPSPLRRALEHELVPRLLPPPLGDAARPAGQAAPVVVASTGTEAGSAVTPADLAAFLREVLGEAEDGALTLVRGLLDRGVTTESIYLEMLAPTARALGDLWTDDSCGFVEVTIALGRMQSVLRALSRMFISGAAAAAPPTGRALLACIPGEQHTLGLFMVAEFLIRDGWGVSVGPPILESDLLQLVREEWFDVVGFSVTCDSRLSRLQREIRRVRAASRNPSVGVIVGGRVFNDQPALVARIGADASATDARAVIGAARRFVVPGTFASDSTLSIQS